jgi:multidrug efflux pump subunit AcrA (membrane-fusion protein)
MRRVTPFIVAGLLVLSLIGCAGQGEETPTPEPQYDYEALISVTGEVVPAQWATLSAQVGGTVVEVLVGEGSVVAAGDPLLRLNSTDAELAAQQAEAALEAARAQLLLLEVAARPEEIAAAEAGLEAAEAVLTQAAAERNRVYAGAIEAESAAAEVEVAEAEAAYRAALMRHDDLRARRKEVKEWELEEAGLLLRAAEQALDAAQLRLVQLRESAGARRVEAEVAVLAATAQRDIAQAQLSMLQAGATAGQITVAQAEVAQAQVELDAARLALERCELRAPFEGTIGSVNVRVGESVAPGEPLVTLGDLDALRVETTDLDEIDVGKVAEGQLVALSFDAFPEQTFNGRVVRIHPMADPGAGGVNYTAIIELEGSEQPAILWGMTAFVDIEAE